jgi:hypothetical protein
MDLLTNTIESGVQVTIVSYFLWPYLSKLSFKLNKYVTSYGDRPNTVDSIVECESLCRIFHNFGSSKLGMVLRLHEEVSGPLSTAFTSTASILCVSSICSRRLSWIKLYSPHFLMMTLMTGH